MRLLLCGDRDWTDGDFIYETLKNEFIEEFPEVLIEGECRGADILGRDAAIRLGLPPERILKFPANWTKYGRRAGPIRNSQMLTEGRPTIVFAFHDNIDKSIGTKDMLNQSRLTGLSIKLFCHHDIPKLIIPGRGFF